MQEIVLATKSDANRMSINLTVSYALFLHYFLHRISCRHTIHVTSLTHLAKLINAVEEFTF